MTSHQPSDPPANRRIISINAGKVMPLFVKDGETTHRVVSGIRKQTVETPVDSHWYWATTMASSMNPDGAITGT